jgi:hypothetical protein
LFVLVISWPLALFFRGYVFVLRFCGSLELFSACFSWSFRLFSAFSCLFGVLGMRLLAFSSAFLP